MKSVLLTALLLCLVALSVDAYWGYGYGRYGGLGGGYYGGFGGGYGYGGYYPHYGHFGGGGLYYNPVHGLHSHGSVHDYDHPVY